MTIDERAQVPTARRIVVKVGSSSISLRMSGGSDLYLFSLMSVYMVTVSMRAFRWLWNTS